MAEKEISNYLKEEGFDVPGKLKGNSVELDSVGRYTMLKSRLW